MVLMVSLWVAWAAAAPSDPYEGVNASWERLGSVYGRILENYYDSLDQKVIMQAAIDGMLSKLDSYSQFYDEEGIRRLRQDTTGKFAGLGITVALKNHYPVVITTMEGTPASQAGFCPGDLITEIEGQDTRNMPLDQVVDALRGDPGTRVQIKISHKAGTESVRKMTLVREIIRIRSVVLVEEIAPGIGYISMRQTRFSEDTAQEVERALKDLNTRNINGVILDLRGNPGGLLGQATQVADLFLPKGVPVVIIKEKDGRGEEVKRSQGNPVAGNVPLVVLIDDGSASASEIVAGAIQDNDRGLIVGTTSFGKGSVQTILDLYEPEESALKLTTARYFTPSGRSIHRDMLPNVNGLSLQIPLGKVDLPAGPALGIILSAATAKEASEAMRVRFELDEEDVERIMDTPLRDLVGYNDNGRDLGSLQDTLVHKTYYTRKGRKVYGGGGITPDIEVKLVQPPDYVLDLERRRFFFDFVVDYVSADTARVDTMKQDEIEAEMVVKFKEFLKQKDAHAEYAQYVHNQLGTLIDLAEEMGWEQNVKESIYKVEKDIDGELKQGFTSKLEPYIRTSLRRELALRMKGREAELRAVLEKDPQLEKAIDLLRDTKRYRQLLEKGSS
jgi:carboxyl-terminal processing protease